jgi:hypothetical protein
MLMKNAAIAIAVLATTWLALASVQAAAEPRRGGSTAAGNKAGGGPGVQPGGTRTTNPKGKKYKAQTPPTRAQPYCPYGKKADGTCWVRCRYTICL